MMQPALSQAELRRSRLPVFAAPTRRDGGYEIRLPVRAEEVAVTKRTVVRSVAVVRRRAVSESQRIDETVRREMPRMDATGDLDVTPVVDRDSARGQTGWGR